MQIRRALEADLKQLVELWAPADALSALGAVRQPMTSDMQRSGAVSACKAALGDANSVILVAEDSEERLLGFCAGRIEKQMGNAYESVLRHWTTYVSEEGQRLGAYAALQAAWQAVDVATSALTVARPARSDGGHDGFETVLQMRGWRLMQSEWGRRIEHGSRNQTEA